MEKELTTTENILDQILRNKILTFLVIIVFLLISLFLNLIQKKEYSSTAQILIIQEQGKNLDAYIATKSAEALSDNLKKALESSSFKNAVLGRYPDLNINLKGTEKNKRKEWEKIVQVKIIPNTAILEISTYQELPFSAEKLLNNILETLFTEHQKYHGGGFNVRLEIIDKPLTSLRPVRPNIFLNLFLSLFLGLFFTITLLILFPNKSEKINQNIKKWFLKIKSFKKENPKQKTKNNKFGFNIDDYLLSKEAEANIEKKYPKVFKDTNLDSQENLKKVNLEEEKKNIIGGDHYLRPKE